MKELYQYQGEPQLEEILQRKELWDKYGKDNLDISHRCPNCEQFHTRWIRNEWSICFDCKIAFTLDDSIGYIDLTKEETICL